MTVHLQDQSEWQIGPLTLEGMPEALVCGRQRGQGGVHPGEVRGAAVCVGEHHAQD
jgi:hypothetical protein